MPVQAAPYSVPPPSYPPYAIQPGYAPPAPAVRPHPFIAVKQIVAIAGAAALAIGVFLPVVKFAGVTISYWDLRDYVSRPFVFLGLAAAGVVLSLVRLHWLLFIAGGIALGLLGHDFVQLQQLVSDKGASTVQIDTEWGAVVLVAGGIAMLVSPFIPRKRY